MSLAIPARIETVDPTDPLRRMGVVRLGREQRRISLLLVPEAEPGDFVLVHGDVALSRINPSEAARTRLMLEAIGALEDDDPSDSPDSSSEPNGGGVPG